MDKDVVCEDTGVSRTTEKSGNTAGAAAAWMDPEMIRLSEVRKTNLTMSRLYGI